MIRPTIEYACEVWHPHLTAEQSRSLEQIQKRALYIVYPEKDYNQALEEAHLTPLSTRRDNLCRKFFVKMQAEGHRLHYLLPPERTVQTSLRKQTKYPLPKVRTLRCKNTLVNYGLFNFQ